MLVGFGAAVLGPAQLYRGLASTSADSLDSADDYMPPPSCSGADNDDYVDYPD